MENKSHSGHDHSHPGECPAGHVHSEYARPHDSGIFEAAQLGNVERLRSLLDKGANASVRDESGYTPLHYACRAGKLDVVNLLLRNGADVNAQTCASLATPLQRASYCGYVDIVRALLQVKGLKVNLQDCDGKTALYKACSSALTASATNAQNYLQICKMLLDSGADPNISSYIAQNTIFHYLAKFRVSSSSSDALKSLYENLISCAISKGGNLNKANKDGLTPLHFAVEANNEEAVKLLLSNGADTRTSSSQGTPIELCQKLQLPDIERLLNASSK